MLNNTIIFVTRNTSLVKWKSRSECKLMMVRFSLQPVNLRHSCQMKQSAGVGSKTFTEYE